MASENKKSFAESNSFETRRITSIDLRSRHPGKIPVVINLPKNSEIILNKTRFLVPGEMKISAFMFELRKYMEVGQSTTIFIFVNNILPPSSITLDDLDAAHRAQDGFLYLSCLGENAFG